MRRLLLLTCLAFARPVWPCAPAPPEGQFVAIDAEQAVIVWDAKEHVEHFIRRASFVGDAKEFGFLVPTPGVPTLSETPSELFDALVQHTQPERISKVVLEPGGLFALRAKAVLAPAGAMRGGVTVLETTRVAGYDAVVLEADDPAALAQWLSEHGYAKRDALTDWLAPYVAQHWKLTAFKIAKGEGNRIATSAVKMSFAAERPFFPYREPADQRTESRASRALRVYLFAPWRAEGKIGDGSTAFPGSTYWAAPFENGPALPVPVPAGAWLTVFQDDASPRPGVDELFFSAAAAQQPVKPEPIIVPNPIPIPFDCMLVALVLGFVLRAFLKRRKRAVA